MNGYTLDYSQGRIRASNTDQLFTPHTIRGADKYGVMALHGATAPDNYALATRWQSSKVAAHLAHAGIPVVAGAMSGDSFANSNSQTDMTNALPLLAQAGCDTTKVHLLGISMGCLLAIQWAGANPDKVASIQGIIPATSIQRIYETNPGGLSAGVATAWGVAAPRTATDGATTDSSTTLTATLTFASPADVGKIIVCPGVPAGTTVVSVTNATTVVMSNPATATGTGKTVLLLTPLPAGADLSAEYATINAADIPVRLHYTTSDLLIPAAGVLSDAALLGATTVDLGGSAGHAEATVGLFNALGAGDSSDYLAFLQAHGA